MKNIQSIRISSLVALVLLTGTLSGASLHEEQITYTVNGVNMQGYVVYDGDQPGKRPAVLVVHEWWGLNDYSRNRAKQLAELGYIAMAVDMYGNGKTGNTPQEAQQLAMPFYQDPGLAKTRLDAALTKIKEYAQTDPANIAAIGYCFGGSVVLNSAKLGADLKGVVSFHGGLAGVPANGKLLKAKILVCNGESDTFVTEQDIRTFRHGLDSIGAAYTFQSYPGATHAFTNPASTETGRKFNMPIAYNADADKNSWNDMKVFLGDLFRK